MIELTPAFDFNILEREKDLKEPIFFKAIRRLKRQKKMKEVQYEDVIDPLEFILECAEVTKTMDKRNGNTNAK